MPIFGHSRWLFALNTYFALWCFVAVFEYLVNLLPFIKLGSSLSLQLSRPPPPLPLSSRFHIYAAGEWSLSDIRLSSKSRRIRKSPIHPGHGMAVPMQRVMSCHKLWDKLCQWWWGHWATCETLPLSPLWQQLTCTSQRQFRGCLSPVSGEEKSWNSCSGYFSQTCEFVPERALAQFIAFGPPGRSPP